MPSAPPRPSCCHLAAVAAPAACMHACCSMAMLRRAAADVVAATNRSGLLDSTSATSSSGLRYRHRWTAPCHASARPLPSCATLPLPPSRRRAAADWDTTPASLPSRLLLPCRCSMHRRCTPSRALSPLHAGAEPHAGLLASTTELLHVCWPTAQHSTVYPFLQNAQKGLQAKTNGMDGKLR